MSEDIKQLAIDNEKASLAARGIEFNFDKRPEVDQKYADMVAKIVGELDVKKKRNAIQPVP